MREYSGEIVSELRILRGRVLELEQQLTTGSKKSLQLPTAGLSPAIWTNERFPGKIVADNGDGSYQIRRQIATAGNTFSDDTDDTEILRAYNIAERSGYTGMYSVDDIVCVDFDGLNGSDEGIYHIW